MGRSPIPLLVAVLGLAACEVPTPPPDAKAGTVEDGATATTAPAVALDRHDLDEGFEQRALALTPEELDGLREDALAGDDAALEAFLFASWIRGDVERLRTLRTRMFALGDDRFRFYALALLDVAGTEPGLLYQLAEDAHAAGYARTLIELASMARFGVASADAYDLQRLGELLRTVKTDGAAASSIGLAMLYIEGAPELGLAADPERGSSLLEQVAVHADARMTFQVADDFFLGRNLPVDVQRAQRLYALAGDKGDRIGHNNAAWLAATCAGFDDSAQAQALVFAQQSIDEWGESGMNVDTLAAVYARLGRFADAVAAQRRAIQLLAQSDPDDEALRSDYAERLALYRARRAYDDPDC